MKNLLIITFILFPPYTHPINWVKVGKSTDGHSFYVDIENIEKKSNFIYFWLLTDWLYPSPYGTLSETSRKKSNCVDDKTLEIETNWYSKNMTEGKLMNSFVSDDLPDGSNKWLYNTEGSIGQFILKFACKHVD